MKSFSDSYRQAGVDVTAGYRGVQLMRRDVERTRIPGVVGGLGGFGGLFDLGAAGLRDPVLVSGTDGVGTKLKIAFAMDRHDTVGIDCVAMCANDIVCSGARPLFFLDYIALGKNVPEKVASIVSGVAEGCVRAGCALVGGETAEMPGFYPADEYDLAGFCVGAAEKGELLGPERVQEGDALIGLASSGVHSNGYSLVRKIFGTAPKTLGTRVDELGGTLGESLLEPTRIYVKAALLLKDRAGAHAFAHITGGGFYENVPRMMPPGLEAVIRKNAVPVPPIFRLIARSGRVPERDMYNTFNMGIGFVAAVPGGSADGALRLLRKAGWKACLIGEVRKGGEGVVLAD